MGRSELSPSRDHYEQLWERLPADPAPGRDFELRRAFLLAHVSPGQRVLDLGCGAGAFIGSLVAARARPVGIDVAEAALRRARAAQPGVDFRRAPVGGPLPLDDGAVDVVWCSEVLEHVADTARFVSEIRRVLAPGGTPLVTTPCHGRLRNVAVALVGFESHADPLSDHLRFYTRRSLGDLLVGFGFEDVRLRAVGGPPLARRTLLASARRAGWVVG